MADAEMGVGLDQNHSDAQASRKRLRISLEPIEAPRVDRIFPDGSLVELPASFADPAMLFARQVARMDAENQRKEKAENAASKTASTFIWKEAVDSLRDAAYQARQLSSFLGLLSRCDSERGKVEGSVMLQRTSQPYQYPPLGSLEGKFQYLTLARTSLLNAIKRLQKQAVVDGTFIRSLKQLRENWNISQIGRIQPSAGGTAAGPVGALSVWIGLELPRTIGMDDCEVMKRACFVCMQHARVHR